MKEIKEASNKWKDISCSWTEMINNVKMSLILKAIYTFSAMLIKIPMTFSIEIEQTILKFVWTTKYSK